MPITQLTPSELVALDDGRQITFTNANLKAVLRNFQDGKSTNSVGVSYIKIGGDRLRLVLKGELRFDGIHVTDHEQYGLNHQIALELDELDDLTTFSDTLNALVVGLIESELPGIAVSEYKSFIKGDKDFLYVKCARNKEETKYAFKSNVKLDPRRETINKASLPQYERVTLTCDCGIYFTLKDNTCGMFIKLVELNVDSIKTEDPVTPKKKKTVNKENAAE
jgi:hypothetical protein